MKRSVEYVDDKIYARKLQEKEEQNTKETELESNLSIILAHKLTAEENQDQNKDHIDALNQLYESTLQQLEALK